MFEPDWKRTQEVIVNAARQAIARFAAEHPEEVCSFFALTANYFYGDVAICFDTPANALARARKHQAWVVKGWADTLAGERGWIGARYQVAAHSKRIVNYSYSSGYFKYDLFSVLQFREWEDYYGDDDLPDEPDPQGHVIVLLVRALDELIASDAFRELKLASPFRVGFELHDDDLGLVVTRILNWPDEKSKRSGEKK